MGYFCDDHGREIPPVKFILVSGGVISGIGKGLTASSIGVLMKSCGWNVTAIKIDPYLNTDAGTMSPFEHGEVFVLADGGEVDLDLGNYERFLDVQLNKDNNITTGKVFSQVLERERRGDYLGKTVQVVPHITNAIQDWIIKVATTPDTAGRVPEICVIELGGTVGDIESMPFVEALRQLRYFVGEANFCSVFVSLVPELGPVGEQKTKPTQHGVKNLSSMGLTPQLVVCRSERPLLPETKRKLGLFCQVAPDAVISVHDVSNTYRIPLMLQDQGVCNLIIRSMQMVWRIPTRLGKWRDMALAADAASEGEVTVCIVGKYTGLSDAYLSVVRALQHAGMAVHRKVVITWVESSDLMPPKNAVNAMAADIGTRIGSDGTASPGNSPTDPSARHDAAWETLRAADAILVPGGFGDRGVEGKVQAIRFAREHPKPFLGICLGMQMAVVEAVREVFNEPLANSSEFDKEAPIEAIIFMPEGDKKKMGGTMRLGVRETRIKDNNCLSSWLYNGTNVFERHRHRYEVNPDLVERLEKETKMRFVGTDTTGKRMEILELRDHPFFLGTQYHPEFASRPGRPSPPFLGFIMAAAGLPLDHKSLREQLHKIHLQDPWAPGKTVNGSGL